MDQSMKLVSVFGVAIAALGVAGYSGYRAVVRASGASSPATIVRVADDRAALIERGRYLLAAAGCTDCHTPHDQKGEPIGGMFLAGHPQDAPLPEWDPSLLSRHAVATIAPTMTAFAGPFGVSVAPNLTPDLETGIGTMTADDLIKSWRTGTHWKESRAILPPMPAPAFATLRDEDIRAIHACLMALPPIKNKAPASRPAGSTAPGA